MFRRAPSKAEFSTIARRTLYDWSWLLFGAACGTAGYCPDWHVPAILWMASASLFCFSMYLYLTRSDRDQTA